jgi:hypothetical protein
MLQLNLTILSCHINLIRAIILTGWDSSILLGVVYLVHWLPVCRHHVCRHHLRLMLLIWLWRHIISHHILRIGRSWVHLLWLYISLRWNHALSYRHWCIIGHRHRVLSVYLSWSHIWLHYHTRHHTCRILV